MNAAHVLRLSRHLLVLVRTGQLRFRLETFGLYYPRPQYSAPWWQISPWILWGLVRRAKAYAAWLEEMDGIAQAGDTSWWESYRRQTHVS
ncbi:MAG: hypothetical protein M3Z66_18090 [Chloroflexota bacterium]|nr:hypothetical protein [Chloroflexota bacterium]